jgi:hypothetical protein
VRPYFEETHHKKRAGGVAQGVGPEFKHQYYKKKKKEAILYMIKTSRQNAKIKIIFALQLRN